jgi:hypothetical protein
MATIIRTTFSFRVKQEQLMEFNDDVIERQFNRNFVVLGSGSDAYLLTGLTKRIFAKIEHSAAT